MALYSRKTMEHMKRTTTCGALARADAGKKVTLNGWVNRKRDHGGISFVNLRDRYGTTQVVVDSDAPDSLKSIAGELKSEYCVAVEGTVAQAGVLGAAYVATKATQPLRILATLALTPLIARLVRRGKGPT